MRVSSRVQKNICLPFSFVSLFYRPALLFIFIFQVRLLDLFWPVVLLFLSFTLAFLRCLSCEHVCVCALFYPKKEDKFVYSIKYINMLYIFISFIRSFAHFLSDDKLGTASYRLFSNSRQQIYGLFGPIDGISGTCLFLYDTFPYVHCAGSKASSTHTSAHSYSLPSTDTHGHVFIKQMC